MDKILSIISPLCKYKTYSFASSAAIIAGIVASTIKSDTYHALDDIFNQEGGGCNVAKPQGVSILIILVLASLLYMMCMFKDDTIWSVDKESTDEQKVYRQGQRGMIASFISVVIFGIVNGLVDSVGNVDAGTSTAAFGAILGGTFGFLADMMMGSEDGWSITKNSVVEGVDYATGSLATPKFARYFVTVLIDLLVSQLIFMFAYPVAIKLPFLCKYKSVANAVVSALIGIVTFNAYANQTRFLWAYPDSTTDKSTWIKPAVIQLALAILSVVWLAAPPVGDDGQPLADPYNASGVSHPYMKLGIVAVSMIILTTMHYTGAMEAQPLKNKELVKVDEHGAPVSEEEIKKNPDKDYILYILQKSNPNLQTTDDIMNLATKGKFILGGLIFATTAVTLLSKGTEESKLPFLANVGISAGASVVVTLGLLLLNGSYSIPKLSIPQIDIKDIGTDYVKYSKIVADEIDADEVMCTIKKK